MKPSMALFVDSFISLYDYRTIVRHLYLYGWPTTRFQVRYTDEALDFFIVTALRDKRDFSTGIIKYPNGKPSTAFQHLIHNSMRKRGLIGSIKGTKINNGTEVAKSIARKMWQALDTPLSNSLLEITKGDDNASWIEALNTTVDPNSDLYQNNSDYFMRDYAAVSILRKYEGLDLGIDTKVAALEGWLKAERQCRETNDRLTFNLSVDTRRFLWAVKKLIQNILGPSPSIFDVSQNIKLGPGATASCPSKYCSIFDKLEQMKYVSPNGYDLLSRILENRPEFLAKPVETKEVGDLDFVKKIFKTDRPVQKPEDYDALVQLGLGNLIRQRLKKFGLDLDHQADKNGLLAKFGSITNKLVTIDLQSASDTIAYQLVKTLLPTGWFNWLNRFRSSFVLLKGVDETDRVNYRLNKFSAMGNGYTFELETLIFLAVTLVSCGYLNCKRLPCVVGVFGDDICCPAMDVENVIKNLQLCGFTINKEKTFINGPFRESCGQDFYLGAPVRPFFMKKEIKDVTQLYTVANGIRRFSTRSLDYYGSDVRYRDVWTFVVSLIPDSKGDSLRVFGSSELGDAVIWGNPEDGISGEWPVFLNSAWTYRSGPIKGRQRSINFGAYNGSTLVTAWGITKGSPPRSVIKMTEKWMHQQDVWNLNNTPITQGLRDATVLPRVFRKHYRDKSVYTRVRALSRSVSTYCDCPAFL